MADDPDGTLAPQHQSSDRTWFGWLLSVGSSAATLLSRITTAVLFSLAFAAAMTLPGCGSGDDGSTPTSANQPTGGDSQSTGRGALQAYVKASNTSPVGFDAFGSSVSLSGDTLAAGALESSCATGVNGDHTNRACDGSGAVYVFTRTASEWSQQAYLKASNTNMGDFFRTVSLSGDNLAVGASGEDSCAIGVNGNQSDNDCENSGAVYVFTRTAGVWTQQAYLKPSNTDNFPTAADLFGADLALSGDTLAVGAWGEDSCTTGINGDQNNNGCVAAGAVYVFTRTNGVWTQQAYVKASDTGPDGRFGISVALSGDTLAVGSAGPGGTAVYVFVRSASVWNQQVRLNVGGSRVALSGDTLAACCDSAGRVVVFTRTNNVWSQQASLIGGDPNDDFGVSVALNEDTLAVGANGEENCARGFNPNPADDGCTASGAVFLFRRTNGTWSQPALVKASNTGAYDLFGSAGAITGKTLAVGAPMEDSCATGINGNQNDESCQPGDPRNLLGAGAAYVYTLP